MAGPYGLQTSGFVVKPLADILSDIETSELALISPSLDIQPTDPIGVINGIVAGALSELWELGAALYSGMDPDTATGDQLTGLGLITGTTRLPATATVVVGCTVNVNAGFNAAPGTMFASVVGSPEHLFYSLDEVDNPTGIPADVTVDFICQDTGPIQALSGTLTVIAVPLSGWNTITNPDDGNIGNDIETDAAFRLRRQQELFAAGSSTADAIRAIIIQDMQPSSSTPTSVPTTSVTVVHNDSDATDTNGVPPHSIEVIARAPGATSGDDQLLANLIADSKAAGIGTYGTDSKIVVDSQGNSEEIFFTRPADTALTISLTITVDPLLYPSDGDDQVALALANYADATYEPGVEVFSLRLVSAAFTVAGVEDITAFLVNGAMSNIVIDIRHVATVDTSDVTVSS